MLSLCLAVIVVVVNANANQCDDALACEDKTLLLQITQPHALDSHASKFSEFHADVLLSARSNIPKAWVRVWVLTLVFVFGCIVWWTASEDHKLRDRRRLQIVLAFYITFTMANTTLVLPDSYDLVVDMGGDATISGLLLSSPWLFMAEACALSIPMKSWPWGFQRKVILSSMVVLGMSSFLFALGANPPPSWHTASRGMSLALARTAIGPCIAFMVFLRIGAQQITPPSESKMVHVVSSLSISFGLGLGPMVSPIVAWSSGASTVEERVAASSYTFSILWVCLFLFSAWCVPSDIAEAIRSVAQSVQTTAHPESYKRVHSSRLVKEQGRTIWWSGLWFNAERTFMITALEAATVFVLEEEFGWRAQFCGIAAGMAFLATLFPCLFYLRNSWSRDTNMLRFSAAIGCLAPLMFIPMPALSGNIAVALILLTDFIVFSSGFVANGLMDGFVTNNCESDTFYSISNYMLAAQFVKIIPRLLTPVLIRYILGNTGRGTYAGFQLLISSLGCLTCFKTATRIDDLSAK